MKSSLAVKIIGDTTKLVKSLDEAEKKVDEFKDEAEKGGNAAQTVGDKSEKASKGVDKMGMSFSGSAAAAGLWGAALTLGIAALTQVEKDTGIFTEMLTGMTKEQRAAAAAQTELNEAIAKGVGSAQAEAFALSALVDVARDDTRTKEERQNAINRINKEYPDLIENLSLETIGTEAVDKAVNKLTESLIRQAKIKGVADSLSKQYEQLAKLQEQSALDAATTTDKILGALGSVGNVGSAFGSILKAGAKNISDGTNAVEKQIAATEERLRKLLGEEASIEYKDPLAPGRKKAADAAVKEAERQRKILEKVNAGLELIDLETARENANNAAEIYEQSGARIKAALASVAEDPLKIGGEEAFLQIKEIEAALDRIKKKVSEGQFALVQGYDINQLKEFEKQLVVTEAVSKSVTSGLNEAFTAMSVGLGKSLAEGETGLERFSASLIQSVVKIMATYLAQSVGAAIAGGASSGAATGPGAIVAIPTMIGALVAAVIGAFAAIPAFAGGGIVPGGSFSGDKVMSFLNSGEMVLNQKQQKTLFDQFNGQMAGNDHSGGNLRLEAVLRGQDIYLSNQRATRDNNRFNRA